MCDVCGFRSQVSQTVFRPRAPLLLLFRPHGIVAVAAACVGRRRRRSDLAACRSCRKRLRRDMCGQQAVQRSPVKRKDPPPKSRNLGRKPPEGARNGAHVHSSTSEWQLWKQAATFANRTPLFAFPQKERASRAESERMSKQAASLSV